jgi:hypothetical protein
LDKGGNFELTMEAQLLPLAKSSQLIIKLTHESVTGVYTISAAIKQHHESILSFKTFHIIL